MKPFDLLSFQDASARWAARQMKLATRTARRYLIADEVGLGKTRIAAAVVDSFRSEPGPLRVLYLAPRNDMCRQNGQSLASALQADLHEVPSLLHLFTRAWGSASLQLTVLPTHALEPAGHSVRSDERLIMAHTLCRRQLLPESLTIQLFKGQRSKKLFQQRLHHLLKVLPPLPEAVGRDLDKRLAASESLSQLSAKRLSLKDQEAWVRSVRELFFDCFLKHAPCDVLVMDEVHEYAELWLEDARSPRKAQLARWLWPSQRPTLLLSATPLHFRPEATEAQRMEALLSFLHGTHAAAKQLVIKIRNLQESLLHMNPQSFAKVLLQKQEVEQQLLRCLSRTERSLLLGREAQPESLSGSYPSQDLWQKDQLKVWLLLRNRLRDHKAQRDLLFSQAPCLSYAPQAQQIKQVLRTRRFPKQLPLYTSFQEVKRNPRLAQIFDKFLGKGRSEDYLWLPPTRPYYIGSGHYAPARLRTFQPQKAMICSELSYVPRFLAAELSAGLPQKPKGKRVLNAQFSTWAQLLFPSPFLSSVFSEAEVRTSQAKTQKQVLAMIEAQIRSRLIAKGWQLGPSKLSSAALLLALESQGESKWGQALTRRYQRDLHPWDKAAQEKKPALSATQCRHLQRPSLSRIFSQQQVKELARIALGSPAVCLLRALQAKNFIDRNGPEKDPQWLTFVDFCARIWLRFAGRDSTIALLKTQMQKGESASQAFLRYALEGNMQAMLDEYLYHLAQSKSGMALPELMRRLSLALGAPMARFRIATGPQKVQVVCCQQVLPFGKYDELASSRDAQREAFNSPFWPFVLITQSRADEGLDFHLYCRDIIHWDLPAQREALEQREGRINRFHSYGVRQQVIQLSREAKLGREGHIWDELYRKAAELSEAEQATRLGLAPHWCVPRQQKSQALYRRHLLTAEAQGERQAQKQYWHRMGFANLGFGLRFEEKDWRDFSQNLFLRHIDPLSLRFDLRPYERSADKHWPQVLPWTPLLQSVHERLATLQEAPQHTRVLERHIQSLREPKLLSKLVHSVQTLLSFMNENPKEERSEDTWSDPWLLKLDRGA